MILKSWIRVYRFYYDILVSNDQKITPLKIRSLVGLIALYPCLVLEPEVFERFPIFSSRVNWFLDNWDFSKKSGKHMCLWPKFLRNRYELIIRESILVVIDRESSGDEHRILLALVDKDKLTKILTKMFDEDEFFSKYGIRR